MPLILPELQPLLASLSAEEQAALYDHWRTWNCPFQANRLPSDAVEVSSEYENINAMLLSYVLRGYVEWSEPKIAVLRWGSKGYLHVGTLIPMLFGQALPWPELIWIGEGADARVHLRSLVGGGRGIPAYVWAGADPLGYYAVVDAVEVLRGINSAAAQAALRLYFPEEEQLPRKVRNRVFRHQKMHTMAGRVLEDCTFIACDFRDRFINNTVFKGCHFDSCDFRGTVFIFSRIEDSTHIRCNWAGAQLPTQKDVMPRISGRGAKEKRSDTGGPL